MSWKSWGDHPTVVAVSVIAGLAGITSLGYTVYDRHIAQQITAKENIGLPVPNIAEEDLVRLQNYRIEVFFLSSKEKDWKRAISIQSYLLNEGLSSNKVQIKPVDISRIKQLEEPTTDEIRFDAGVEEDAAQRLQNLLNQATEGQNFVLRDANNPTPPGPTVYYLSIFLEL